MLPVLLEELKSASLPEKQQGREKHEGTEPENVLASSLAFQGSWLPAFVLLTQQLAGFQSSQALSVFLTADTRTSFLKHSLEAEQGWSHKQVPVLWPGMDGDPHRGEVQACESHQHPHAAQSSRKMKSIFVSPKVVFPREFIFGLLSSASHT